ncbi:MAG: flagellar biosynthesis protein FlhB [Pseudomonadota bacterium]
MSEDQDPSQKTEEPTSKKLDEARKKGDAPKSQEVSVWFVLLAATAAAAMLSGPAARGVGEASVAFLDHPHAFQMDPASLMKMLRTLMSALAAALGLIGALLVIGAFLGNYVQQQPVLSAEKMKPKLSKISPISGAKRLFGTMALVNFGKGIAKLGVVGALLFFIIWPERDKLGLLVTADPVVLLPLAKGLALKMMGGVLAALAVIAALDYVYQRHTWYERQRMTKQEVKDEHKQSEGDPLVKAKIRQLRQERARQRMMAEVPNASVVITNPTHFAVALKYEAGALGAPVCVAKGVDALALKIRETAKEHKVPIVENPPLARALHATVELEEEIPVEHYKAVAQVISFVMKKARAAGAPVRR